MRHFISIADYSSQELRHTLDVAKRLKKQLKSTGRNDPLLAGKTLAMIFEKPSLRTRVSFAVAMTQLGGNGLLLRDEEVGLDKREPRRMSRACFPACATGSWPAPSSTGRSRSSRSIPPSPLS